MIKLFFTFVVLFSNIYAIENNYAVFAKNGDIVIEIQKMKENINKDHSYILESGVTVKLIAGPGKAIIKNNNEVIKQLVYKNNEYKIPSEGWFEYTLNTNYIENFFNPKLTEDSASSKGISDTKTMVFHIYATKSSKYYTLYSKLLTPTPVVLTIMNETNESIVSYKFSEDDFDTTNKDSEEIVFFKIPTKLLNSGQTYKVTCGSRSPEIRLQGKINIISN